MNRREFVSGLGAAVGAAGIGANAAPVKNANRKPNLIYVFADQLRYQSCGYAGDELARTPNMDRLASEGSNVHQAVSSTPVCAPYRASLMTGKYQSSTGMVINEIRLSPEHKCFGHVLTEAGYNTGYIGKWHMWANQLGHHDLIKNGFVPPGPYRLGFDGLWAAYNFNHYYFHSPYFLNNAEPHIRQGYEPDGQTDMAIDFVKHAARRDEPFALFLSWGPPHYPWGLDNVDPKWSEQFRNVDIPLSPNYSSKSDPYADNWQKLPENYDSVVHNWMRTYYAQTASLDANLGRLMQAVEAAGLADDTIFVFTSDHGEMFGAHGRQAKLIFYEEAARIPFLVRWPKKIAKKTVTDVPLCTPDIMPTLLSMMGLPIPCTVEGQDLSAAVLGQRSNLKDTAHMQGMGATAAWADGTEWRALRDREYTYAIYRKDHSELLFNNRRDPYQLINLAEDRTYRSTLQHYRGVSEAWRKEQNDTFEACSWYERWTKDRNIVTTAKGVPQDLDALDRLVTKWFPNGKGDVPVEHWPIGT
jgi:arylsulfatase A-like enzyme